jgi:hypothetical protein
VKKPNFFIIGAPKCGTTALSNYLRTHPNLFFSEFKEPNYFNTDFTETFRVRYGTHRLLRSDADFLRLFERATEQHKAIGEGTVWYLCSQVAAKGIQAFNQKAKIIVMFRNPVDLAYSLHSQLLYSFNENVNDFEAAWRLQKRRQRGESIPRTCLDPKVLQYRDVCLLGSQLERLYRVFPRNQVLTISFDDFVGRTRELYEDVLAFLGLESNRMKYFPRINVRKSHRVRFINYWLVTRAPLWLRKATRTVKTRLGVNSLGIYRMVKKYNVDEGLRQPLNLSTRQMLRESFSDDIDLLGKLISRDLGHWK